MSRSRMLGYGMLVVAGITMLAGCGPTAPMPTPTPSPSHAATGDGVLRIGTLIPTSGAQADIGASQVAGVERAVRDINLAGGVNGVPVEVFHRNSGDGASGAATAALASLTARGVDVVIGPSTVAQRDEISAAAAAAGITVISPVVAPSAEDAVDGVFGLSGSYAGQAESLARGIVAAGAERVALVYVDDADGAALAESLGAALGAAGARLAVASARSAGDMGVEHTIASVEKSRADAVVLSTPAASPENTLAIIAALTEAGFGGEKLWLTTTNTVSYSASASPHLLAGVHGILAGAQPDAAFRTQLLQSDPGLTSFRFAAESYDATVLAALAALAAVTGGDDGGPAIARALRDASSSGIPCHSFGECIDVLQSRRDIDYDGLSGAVDLGSGPPVASSGHSLYGYRDDGAFSIAPE